MSKRTRRERKDRGESSGPMEAESTEVPASKLLNYVKKEDLMHHITPQGYYDVVIALREKLDKPNIQVRDVKRAIPGTLRWCRACARVRLARMRWRSTQLLCSD